MLMIPLFGSLTKNRRRRHGSSGNGHTIGALDSTVPAHIGDVAHHDRRVGRTCSATSSASRPAVRAGVLCRREASGRAGPFFPTCIGTRPLRTCGRSSDHQGSPAFVMHTQSCRADTYRMGRELSLTCASCGRRFASALQMDPQTFGQIRVTNHLECCRLCGHTARYRKSDYYFTELDRPHRG
jgi:hypothetical protein